MIEANEYIRLVKEYYSFLTEEFNLSMIDEKVRGNVFYDVQYGDKIKVVSINYENIEDYFQVIVFKLQNGKMPDYDDKAMTLHLNKLNISVLPKVDRSEIVLNNTHFDNFDPRNELGKRMLKSAKELRLCLRHLYLIDDNKNAQVN